MTIEAVTQFLGVSSYPILSILTIGHLYVGCGIWVRSLLLARGQIGWSLDEPVSETAGQGFKQIRKSQTQVHIIDDTVPQGFNDRVHKVNAKPDIRAGCTKSKRL